VESLSDLSDDQVRQAIGRAIRELKFFPRVAELREMAGAGAKQTNDAEMRAAWDIVIKHVSRWGRWNCERDHAYIEQGAPELSAKITDVVRRSGTWTAYLAMDADSFPFQQQRFFAEYAAIECVERVDLSHMITAVSEVRRLAAAPSVPTQAKPAQVRIDAKPIRSIPNQERLSEAQCQDRRALLRQQLDALRQRATADHTEDTPSLQGESHNDQPQTPEQARA
jgi:hypothetical protein